ncbi:Retrovirus-related Pol poly from transposon TNT 1-94 [Paramuricea clavata]|uniref:Retrovirus-related Pol poly from transposon TNT 1-94 n=1 Tax=Paramuricea clavata TaxID=317549 RepID=A0A7D9D8Q7_PARCT|nr:Retrovirus-related Pol poly from transposon TNT 1-94 [Paramuricea clavata]
MPSEFWDEAVSTATYVQNRSPTTSLKGIIPFECLYNRKPDVSNLRVFGCIAFAHIPKHMRKKLEEISRKCVFVGYPEGTKASAADDKDADDQVAVEHVIPVPVRENRNQPVGETYKDTFMQEVQNLNLQRKKISSQIR